MHVELPKYETIYLESLFERTGHMNWSHGTGVGYVETLDAKYSLIFR